jgi:hypothetical protein
MARLFISQKRLDEWVEQQRVELSGNEMTLDDGRRFMLAEGVCFAEVVGGEADPNDLIGRVKSKAQLDEMGAEHFPGSVIVGDVGYEVKDGFIGEPA